MDRLILFNLILIAIIFAVLYICKRYIKNDKTKNLVLLLAAILTILCHYSSLLYHQIVNGTAMEYLKDTPNLILPMYPCNVVMWGCLIYGLMQNKESKGAKFLADYLFWFGIFSTLVGMFANVDFIENPTLRDYDVTKGIVAHATLLFNVLLICTFGHIKVDLVKNLKHITMGVILMLFIGLYCNLMFEALVSYEEAYDQNSMFLLHSPFEGVPFLVYPVIAGVALVLYFGLFSLCEVFAYEKGNRWFNRMRKK